MPEPKKTEPRKIEHLFIRSPGAHRDELHLKKLEMEAAFWRDVALEQDRMLSRTLGYLNAGWDVQLNLGSERVKMRRVK